MADDSNAPKPPPQDPAAPDNKPPESKLPDQPAPTVSAGSVLDAPRPTIPADSVLDAPRPTISAGSVLDAPQPAQSGLVKAGFVVSLISFLGSWIPFLGYIGIIGAILALVGRSKSATKRDSNQTVAAVILGIIGLGAGIVWTAVVVAVAHSSCPHVYAWNGHEYEVDADMVSGAFFEGAETDDVDRLEHLERSEGHYLVRVANERDETDFIDRLSLEVVDHPAGTTALPTLSGDVAVLGELRAPLAARDGFGRDHLASLGAEDALSWQGNPGDHDPDKEALLRDTLDLTLPATEKGAFLVLNLRNTEAGTDALYDYLGQMGPGVADLLKLSQGSTSYPYRQRIADEMDRLGIPLVVEIKTGDTWSQVAKVRPIGPATLRYVAIPLPETSARTPVEVRLTAVPAAWEIDRVAVAAPGGAQASTTLRPLSAVGTRGEDLSGRLASADGQRVKLEKGEKVDVAFAAPPAASGSTTRSVFARMRGYYDVPVGGHGWLNPIALARHKLEPDAAPRFFLRSLRRAN